MGGCIKGVSFVYTMEFITTRFGTEGVEKIKARLGAEDYQLLFERPVLPASWVDYAAYMKFFLQIDKTLGKGDHQLLEEMASYGTKKMLRGVHKFFISLTSPRFILNNSQNVWRQNYDTGRIVVEWVGEKRCLSRIYDWPDIPEFHEYDIMVPVKEAILLSGGRNPAVVHTKCMARGDEYCLFDEKWE